MELNQEQHLKIFLMIGLVHYVESEKKTLNRTEKLAVKVGASAKQLDVSEDNPLEVELIGLEMSPVWTPNGYIVRATAKGIKAVGKTE